jgi:ubiquinone/menaquinone biosynthesis C-methylase UbiE
MGIVKEVCFWLAETMKDNIDFWQDVLNDQPQSFKDWFEREKAFLRENIKSDSLVLEVGCGNGRSIFDLLSVTQNITGIDHDPKTIDEAKKNFSSYKTINLQVANATALPFNNNTFEYVLCLSTFVNFADAKYRALEEMKRVLKSDGKIIMSVYNEDALPDRMSIYKKIGLKLQSVDNGKVVFDENFVDNISEQFSESELLDIFSKSNLKVDKLEKLEVAYLIMLSI